MSLLPRALAAVGLLTTTILAQTSTEPVVRAPEVVVNGARLPADAMGTTRVELEPETAAPVGSWEALSRAAPNLHVAGSGAEGYGTLFSLRGLANTPYFSEPAVTVYLGDIPLPSSFTYPSGLFGFNSAAVFRGPQGTQFGRATDGGVIVFSPVDAAAAAGGEILAGYGSYQARQFAAVARTATSGRADAEFAGAYSARQGTITNQQLGVRVDDQESENGFGRIRFRPAPGNEWTLTLLTTRARDGAQPLVPIGGPLFTVRRAGEGVTDLDSDAAALKGSWELPAAARLTSVTSFTDWRMNPYKSFLVLPPALTSEIEQRQKSWNEELHFETDPAAPVHGSAGAWLAKGTTLNSVNRALPGLFPIEISSFEQGNEAAAVFGEAGFTLDPAWQLTAGLRAETEEKNFTRHEKVPTAGLSYVGTGRYRGLLPRLALNWAATADSHFEAAVALGLRPGGFASYTDNPALVPFASERTTAGSLGWDITWGHHAFDLAVRAFYDAISNDQIERSFSANDYFVATAPKAHAAGGEIEARWHPAAGWTAIASGGWTEARLDTFRSPFTGADESGHRTPNAPSATADLELAYRPGRGWFAASQLSVVGPTSYDELDTAKYTQRAYALIGARTGYETARWTLTVYGENLANQGYYTLIIPGVNSANPGAPRTFGAEATLKF